MTFDGAVTSFAGSGRGEDGDGAGSAASFKDPIGLALDSAGNLYVADSGNNKIRKVTPSGVVTTFAGAGRPGYSDGEAAIALFKHPRGVAVSPLGAVYVADTQNHAIRRIENGAVSTVAGTTHGGSTNGPANVAEFNEPTGMAIDDAGQLWIGDTRNHQMRRVAIDGVISTVAGTGKPGYADAVDLLQAHFHEPTGLAAAGAIFITDSKNDAVRMLVPVLTATNFQPRSGTPDGGQTVHVFGSGFIPGRTEVTFGGVPASTVVYVSSTELIALTPPRPIGDAEVRVSTLGGTRCVPIPVPLHSAIHIARNYPRHVCSRHRQDTSTHRDRLCCRQHDYRRYEPRDVVERKSGAGYDRRGRRWSRSRVRNDHSHSDL